MFDWKHIYSLHALPGALFSSVVDWALNHCRRLRCFVNGHIWERPAMGEPFSCRKCEVPLADHLASPKL